MRDADVLEEVVVCETNQVPRCSFAPLVVVVCETKTRSFVFICTHLTATLVDGPCRPGNRECPPIIKESPQLPPIKIKMGGWTNSWKSFQFIFTNTAIDRGLIWELEKMRFNQVWCHSHGLPEMKRRLARFQSKLDFCWKGGWFQWESGTQRRFQWESERFPWKNSKKTSTKNSKKIPGRMLGLLTLLRISKTTDYKG